MPVETLLRDARLRAGLTQETLARRAGTTQSSIARLERGLVSPRLVTLERLLETCGFELQLRRHRSRRRRRLSRGRAD